MKSNLINYIRKFIPYFSNFKFYFVMLCIIAQIISITKLHAGSYGTTILGMYKSSDGYSENNNPLKLYFEPEINKLGLKIQYHDFDKGIPNQSSLNNIRAIITWYNNGVIDNKQICIDYVDFLTQAVDSGIKLIIVNSFGAYGYKDGKDIKWDLIQYIQPLYFKLGFAFKGFWTNDPKKLRIVKKEGDFVEKEDKQDITKSLHYQQIIPFNENIDSHLIIERTDKVKGLGNGKSSIIFTSPFGGFALEQYVIRGNKLLLNPSKFLRSSLFFNNGSQKVGVILGDLKNYDFVKTNLSYALKYAKINFTIINLDQLKSSIAEDLSIFEAVLIATDTVNQIPSSVMKNYVQNGGNLIFIKSAELNNAFMELVGLKEYDNKNMEYFKEGFSLKPIFFMNKDQLICKNIDLNVRKAKLIQGKVLATVQDMDKKDSYPVLWERSLGKGKILFWNTGLLFESKRYRGTIVQSIHYVCDNFVSGLANIGLMMIDDFPAPWWNLNYKPYRIQYYTDLLKKTSEQESINNIKNIIKKLKEYPDISDTDFIKNIWIKDIQNFQKEFGFKYSSFLIFNYSKETSSTGNKNNFFINDFYLAEDGMTVKMGLFALANGWELGLHGYNHMSMTVTRPKDYAASEPWPNRESMLKALTLSRKEWEKIYSPATLPFSYVAPHNIIDANGLSALAEAFPSIRVISTVYVGRNDELAQEFEWSKDRIFFNIPRTSFGYYMSNSDIYVLHDVIHNFGVVSHFIHPDDVFDESRSSTYAGWDWLKAQFVKEFSHVKKNYPWLRWMTVKDAFYEFQFYENNNINVKKTGNTIIIESTNGSKKYIYFRISLKQGEKIAKLENCEQVHANNNSGDIILKTNSYRSKIILR